MPDRNQHLLQAQRNREFGDSVDCTQYPEWVVVAWFYAVLHLVDAFLADSLPDSEAHPTSHRRRGLALAHADPGGQYDELWERYRKLETLSRVARYDCQPDAPEFTDSALQALRQRDFLPSRRVPAEPAVLADLHALSMDDTPKRERIISGTQQEEDLDEALSLRPRTLEEYNVGQDRLIRQLQIAIHAAQGRGSAWSTCSLTGRRGWGRLRWPTSSPARWARKCTAPAAPPWSARRTWWAC